MTRTRRLLSAALVATLASACLLAGTSGAAALPRSVPLTAEFTNLEPGDSASHAWRVDIPYDARVQRAVVHRDGSGDATWTATLCHAGGGTCVNLLAGPVGRTLEAGTYDLAVGVTVGAFEPGDSQQIEGQLTFVQRDSGSLAMTGAASLVPLLVAALAAVTVGLLLLVVARRRRSDDSITTGETR